MKIFRYFKILEKKGEGMPSPFLFLTSIFFMLSISAAQYGTEEWLHPGTNIFTTKDTSNFMQLYNYSHIGVINFEIEPFRKIFSLPVNSE